MNVDDIFAQAQDSMTVRRVIGDPYEKDGVTFIPAAIVRGGAGGGSGTEDGREGGGGGFGLSARPIGAYQIKDGEVTWVPAVDTTKIVLVGQLIAIVALLVLRSMVRRRRKR